jgi:D-sedoheptulose 7-phosphate isomerase
MNAQWHEVICKHLVASAEVTRLTAQLCVNEIDAAARLIADCLQQRGKILLCGNGGSAADSQHIAAEFVNSLTKNVLRPALAAIALTTDSSIITAGANDYGFDTIFARQVEALGQPGDVLIGISTSGTSVNVIQAILQAQTLGIHTVALTGATASPLAETADIVISVPSSCTQHIQETHIAVGHTLCAVVENIVGSRQEGHSDHNENTTTN